jgi:hypothetical protein
LKIVGFQMSIQTQPGKDIGLIVYPGSRDTKVNAGRYDLD